jgi:hypothetical protein
MGAPDVLGIPAPAGVITALSVAAKTIVAASIILAVGFGMLLIAMHLYGKRLEFLLSFRTTVRRAFLPTLSVFAAGIFLALIMEYLTPGHAFFFAERDLTESSTIFYILSYIGRIVFLAGIALASGCAFIAIANHKRGGDERTTVFALRIVCGAVFAALCGRTADIWITASNHPANPELSGIIIVGTLATTATMGSAILGILRPRRLLWSIATAVFLLAGIAASNYVSVHFADEVYRAMAPTFSAAYRIQPMLMTAFFAFTSCALAAIGLTVRWFIRDVRCEM